MSSDKDTISYSLTEIFNPQYRRIQPSSRVHTMPLQTREKNTARETDKGSDIMGTFKEINCCIGSLEELFRTRMKVHEEGLIQIAYSELRKIHMESQKVID